MCHEVPKSSVQVVNYSVTSPCHRTCHRITVANIQGHCKSDDYFIVCHVRIDDAAYHVYLTGSDPHVFLSRVELRR